MSRLFIIISLLFLTLSNWGQTEEKIMLNKGIEAYKNGNFNLALENFNNGYKTNGDYKKALFNAGNAALFNDSTGIAKDLFSEYVSIAENKIEKSKGYYNLGNVQYKEYENLTEDPEKSEEAIKTLKESIQSYKNALRNNPKDNDARHNLKLAMSKLPPPNENQDQQNQDNNQDQENQDQNQDQQDKENKEGQDKEGENKKDGENGENKENQQKDGDKGDEEKEGEGQQNKEENQKDGEQKGNQGKESQEKGEEEMQGKISRIQATKDLDALNNDEQKTLMKVNRKKGDQKQQNSSSKDW